MRRAFTLIELLVVLGIIALLAALSAPAMVQASQRARVSEAAGRIHQVWMQARNLALAERAVCSEDVNGNGALDDGEDRNGNGILDAAVNPRHYGLVLVQPATGTPWVGLIYDNRAAAAVQASPDVSLLQRKAGQPVLRFDLPAGIEVATAAAFGGVPAVTPCVLVAYAQFGTGCPIGPAAVAAGTGASSGLVSLGTLASPLSGNPGAIRVVMRGDPAKAAGITIHEAGICTVQVF